MVGHTTTIYHSMKQKHQNFFLRDKTPCMFYLVSGEGGRGGGGYVYVNSSLPTSFFLSFFSFFRGRRYVSAAIISPTCLCHLLIEP